ncbi:hypothetical protein J4H86_03390 [Spiractinospora alimapuensis]|nr:hypothetical protein J4H86_03390 [Spiractinospora alimapuensis]
MLLATAVATAFGSLTTSAGASSGEAPEPTVSRYVPLEGTAGDLDRAQEWGCAEGETGRSGLRVLFFGTQESGGELRQPGTSTATRSARVSADRAVEVAARWAEGFTSCRKGDAEAILSLGVNNKDDGGVSGSDAGRAWAEVVDSGSGSIGSEAVSVVGGVDAEPSWSTPQWARDWVDAYLQTTELPLYAANSADGCPAQGSGGGSCSNGWSVSDVHYVAGGAGSGVSAVPQIYRTDGIQARQWASISAWGAANGEGALRFAGAMAQQKACEQRSCDGTDNSPEDAWSQLWEAIDAESGTRQDTLPHATDIRWP